ncbi:MAG TPA: hypothetical protein VEW08_14790 [Steroidobacteraceae bacterium]|nr:hypothetical protein [Steroidobacteraceae bacterium]
MQFEFNEEQLALQESVRRFLTQRYDFETRRNSLAKPTGSNEIQRNIIAHRLLGL